ncbi:MAG TPA: hypothetical protein VN778_04550 [Verrucomicrobiae bacterium]|nr:hypothetical protein [Verrucomicrobiae bacterium]
MRAINHAITGAFIGLAISEPVAAIPVAIASHFVCDAIPHYDGVSSDKGKAKWLRSKTFRYLLYADAILCGGLVLVLALKHPFDWQLAAICAFAAAAPDFLWLKRYLNRHSKQQTRPNAFSRFAGRIQWFQRPIGAVVEIAWFVAGLLILAPFIR